MHNTNNDIVYSKPRSGMSFVFSVKDMGDFSIVKPSPGTDHEHIPKLKKELLHMHNQPQINKSQVAQCISLAKFVKLNPTPK